MKRKHQCLSDNCWSDRAEDEAYSLMKRELKVRRKRKRERL